MQNTIIAVFKPDCNGILSVKLANTGKEFLNGDAEFMYYD
jgi:hypothetical protein